MSTHTDTFTHTWRQGAWGDGRYGWLRRKLRRPIKGPGYQVNFRLYLIQRHD